MQINDAVGALFLCILTSALAGCAQGVGDRPSLGYRLYDGDHSGAAVLVAPQGIEKNARCGVWLWPPQSAH
jgi:hypothetical protein